VGDPLSRANLFVSHLNGLPSFVRKCWLTQGAKLSPYKWDIWSGVWLYSVWVALIPYNFDSLLLSDLSKTCQYQVRSCTSLALILREKMTDYSKSSLHVHVAWVNSRHFVTPLPVSPRNDVWERSAEIPYWWCVTTQIWVVLLQISLATRPIRSTSQICVVMRHEYGMNPLVPQTLVRKGRQRGFRARENRGAPLAFLSRLKLPLPSLSNACHTGYSATSFSGPLSYPSLSLSVAP